MSKDYGLNSDGSKVDITRGDLVRFWPEDLIPNDNNYRFEAFDSDPAIVAERDKQIEKKVASLIEERQKQPIGIHEVTGKRFKVHYGDTRHLAFLRINERRIWPWNKPEDEAKNLEIRGRARIECVVENFGVNAEKEYFGASIVENLSRNDLSVISLCVAVSRAEKLGYTDAEIMRKFHQTDPAFLPNMRRLARLPDHMKRQIHLKQMAPSVGYLLAEIPEEAHAEVLAEVAGVPFRHPDGTVRPLMPGDLEAEAMPSEPTPTCPDCDSSVAREDNPKICVGCNQPFDMADARARAEQTLDYSESQERRPSAGKPSAAKPKPITARAVASAAKKLGHLKHKKIANTIAGMKAFWEPITKERKGSLIARLAEAQIAWLGGEANDDRFYKEVLAILREAK